MTRIDLEKKALDFYESFFVKVGEDTGAETVEGIQQAYYGICAAGAAFLGALIEHFYQEPADFRHIFFTALANRGTPFGSLGLSTGEYRKSEARQLFRGLLDDLDSGKLDAFWKKGLRR